MVEPRKNRSPSSLTNPNDRGPATFNEDRMNPPPPPPWNPVTAAMSEASFKATTAAASIPPPPPWGAPYPARPEALSPDERRRLLDEMFAKLNPSTTEDW